MVPYAEDKAVNRRLPRRRRITTAPIEVEKADRERGHAMHRRQGRCRERAEKEI